MSEGYVPCACRDCFEIAIAGDEGPHFCWECEEAGCEEGEECQVEPPLCEACGDGEYILNSADVCTECGMAESMNEE